MLLYPFLALVTYFPRTLITKNNDNNGKNPLSCPFPSLLRSFQTISFINEEATDYIIKGAIGSINKAAIGDIIARRNPPYCFLFHVLLFH